MLEELRGLDRGQDRRPSAPVREDLPGRERLVVPSETPQHMRPIHGDPLRRPWGVDGCYGRTHRDAQRPARSSTEVRDATGRPPRLLAAVGFAVAVATTRRVAELRGRRLDLAVDGGVEARERLVEAALAGERAGKTGEIAR